MIADGRVFRLVDRHSRIGAALSEQMVGLTIKERAELFGLDAREFAGHFLCAGQATAAPAGGIEERLIMRQTRHTGLTVRRHIRNGEVFLDSAAGKGRTVTGHVGPGRTRQREKRQLLITIGDRHASPDCCCLLFWQL